jgi:hypothetical protein
MDLSSSTTARMTYDEKSSAQEDDAARRKRQCEYCEQLIEKYGKGIEATIEETCATSNWIYSWLFVDLQEWDLTNRFKHGIHTRSQKEIWPPPDDRILRIREKLAFLQTQMVNSTCYTLSPNFLQTDGLLCFSRFGFFSNSSRRGHVTLCWISTNILSRRN